MVPQTNNTTTTTTTTINTNNNDDAIFFFDSPEHFDSPQQKEACESIVDDLTMKELELAAQSSYTYWKVSLDKQQTPSNETRRRKTALREAKRFYVASKERRELALEYVRKTCQYREEYRVDLLRACFDTNHRLSSQSDRDLVTKYESFILEETANQKVFVHGQDKEDCAILRLGERTCVNMSDEAFLITQLYMVERALATTESMSRGAQETMCVVVDATCFQSKCAPSRSTLTKLLSILQNHYPQRLKRLIVLNPPIWLRSLYTFLSPFLDARTRKKFQLATGEKAKKRVFKELIGGKSHKVVRHEDVDMRRFMMTTPFQCSYLHMNAISNNSKSDDDDNTHLSTCSDGSDLSSSQTEITSVESFVM